MKHDAPKLLLLGLSGLEWDGLTTRIAAGRLPRLAALAAAGASGRLLADVPPDHETACWATIATGLLPETHGQILETEPWAGGLRPAGRASWAADPLWLRLANAGLATAGAGWPAAVPGAAWPGAHVDARVAAPTGLDWDDWALPRGVAPPRLRETLRDLRVHPRDVTGDMLAPFVPDLPAVDQSRDRRLIDLALMLARFSTGHAAALTILAQARWDAAFVHHDWLARLSPHFAGAAAPFDRVVETGWAMLDAIVGATAAALPSGTTLLIVSPGLPGRAGIVVATGPGIAAGQRLAGMRTIDVAPTVLGRFGLGDPALAGRPWLGAPGPLRQLPPGQGAPPAVPPDADDLARVAAFGHAPPAPPLTWFAELAARRAELLAGRDPAAAGAPAERALTIGGDAPVPLALLALSHVARGEAEKLPALADRIAAVAPGHRWEALIRGGYHAMRGQAQAARPFLARVEAEGDADERMRVGAAWLMLGRLTDARRLFEAVLADQPDRADALVGLAATHVHAPLAAEPPLRRALALDPRHAAARAALADLLRRAGRAGEADALADIG